MFLNTAVWIKVMLAILIAFVVSFALTPVVKILAQKVGAMDVPGEARRVHDHPIPRRRCAAFCSGRSSSSSPA